MGRSRIYKEIRARIHRMATDTNGDVIEFIVVMTLGLRAIFLTKYPE